METNKEADRFSSLPEPILHHILSFLLSKDALQTCLSSKGLYQVWTTFPYLDLGQKLFPSFPAEHNKEDKASLPEIIRKREIWFNFIGKSLTGIRGKGLSMMKFRLCVSRVDLQFALYLERWIQYLVSCNIKELILGNDIWHSIGWILHKLPPILFSLPPILLSSTTLCVLTVRNFSMPMSGVKLVSLRKLQLVGVFVVDQFIRDIISTCHRLEQLELCECHGFQTIEVSGLLQLRDLNLSFNEVLDEVKIEAPNLEKLIFLEGNTIDLSTTYGTSLKYLELYGTTITSTCFSNLISKLVVLEVLEVGTLMGMEAIKISSRSLKSLRLRNVFDHDTHMVREIEIDAPILSYLLYGEDISSTSLKSNLVAPEIELYIFTYDRSIVKDDLRGKLMQLLRKFDYSETVRLTFDSRMKIIFPMEKKAGIVSPLPNIKHLKVEVLWDQPMNDATRLIDDFLWISPSLSTISIKFHGISQLSAQFTYGNFTGIEEKCCDCIALSRRCWRHSLTHVKYELKGATVDAEEDRWLRIYFTDNAKFLKKIDGSFGHPCTIVLR